MDTNAIMPPQQVLYRKGDSLDGGCSWQRIACGGMQVAEGQLSHLDQVRSELFECSRTNVAGM